MGRRPLEFDAAAALAEALGLPVSDTASQPAALLKAWEGLSPVSRAVITTLVELGGAAPMPWLAYESAQTMRPRSASAADVSACETETTALWERGLVARDRETRAYFLLPAAALVLAPLVRRAVLQGVPVVSAPVPAVDEHVLACAFNVVRREPLKVTRDARPYKRTLELLAEKLGPLLSGPDLPASAAEVLDALVELRLLVLRDGALEADLAAAAEWAGRSPAARRAALLPEGEESSDDAWLLLRQHQSLAPDRAFPPLASGRVFRRALARAERFDVEPEWPAAFATAAAARHERCVTLLLRAGLLARTEHGLALTAEGRAFPAGAVGHGPSRIHVGGDLAVLVPRGLPASTHLDVGAVALLVQADVVARYRLERGVVLDALDRGWTPSQVVGFLEAQAAPALPEAVRRDILRWCERFGEISTHVGVVFACDAPDRHAELAAVVAASELPVHMIAPGVAVVAPLSHEAFHRALVAAGFTPRRLTPERVAGQGEAAGTAGEFAAPEGWASHASWGEGLETTAHRAIPPPKPLVARIKERYRREFGTSELLALDALDVDELLELEERGRVRQFLSNQGGSRTSVLPNLEDYVTEEPVPITPVRAKQVLSWAVTAGARCQVEYVARPGGRRSRLTVLPLEVVQDGAGGYVLARLPGGEERRMLALERIAALRVLPLAKREGGG